MGPLCSHCEQMGECGTPIVEVSYMKNLKVKTIATLMVILFLASMFTLTHKIHSPFIH